MKKILLLTLGASLLFCPTPSFGANPLSPLGLSKACVFGGLFWLSTKSRYVPESNKNLFKHIALFLVSRDAVNACLESTDLGKFTGGIPIFGEWIKRHFFDCSQEKKELSANLSGFMASIMGFSFIQSLK